MGWLLKIKETKSGTKYKIWTTMSDGWITEDWLTRDEMVKFLFWYKFRNFVEDFVKTSMTFPDGWAKKDDPLRRICDDDSYDEWRELFRASLDDDELMYNKFFEKLDKIGINIDINDGEFQVKTPEK
jgi:hypothetical protein